MKEQDEALQKMRKELKDMQSILEYLSTLLSASRSLLLSSHVGPGHV